MIDAPYSGYWDTEAELAVMHAVSSPFGLRPELGMEPITHEHALYNFERMVVGFTSYMAANTDDRWFCQSLHRPLCDFIQFHILDWHAAGQRGEQMRKKVMVIMPRFSGKSETCTKGSTAWGMLLDANLPAAIGSEVLSKACEIHTALQQAISGGSAHSRWVELYGNFKGDRLREWSKSGTVHAWRDNLADTNPSINTWAVDSGLTMYHPKFGFMDDPTSEAKMRNDGTWLSTTVKGVRDLRPAFRTHSFFGVVLTRKHDLDVASLLIDEGIASWNGDPPMDERFTKAIRPSGEWHVYYRDCYDENGESVLPMWTTKALRAYESSDPVTFANEMRNRPGAGEHMSLDANQIEEMMTDPSDTKRFPPEMVYTIHLDTAFADPKNLRKQTKKKDWNVIEVWGHDTRGTGTVVFMEAYGSPLWRGDEFTAEFIRILSKLYTENKKVFAVTDEESPGKKGLLKTHLTNACHFAKIQMPRFIEISRRSGRDNTTRIIEASNFWADGRVLLLRGAPGLPELIDQMLRIGYTPNDDFASAGADVFDKRIYRPLMLKRASISESLEQPGDRILQAKSTMTALAGSITEFESEDLGPGRSGLPKLPTPAELEKKRKGRSFLHGLADEYDILTN